MTLLRLLPLLLCYQSLAQVTLLIEDETKSGFLLGINGYVQNTDPVKEMAIQQLDTFPFEVRVELAPRAFFTKPMHFHESGTYRYVITTNSRDELQLRYRGTLAQLPTGVLAMKVQNILPLTPLVAYTKVEEKPLTKPTVTAESEAAATSVETVSTAAIQENTEMDTLQPLETEVEKPVTVQKPIDPDLNQPLKVTDTLTSKTIVVAKPVAPASTPTVTSFATFVSELEATEFEFEKLEKAREFASDHRYTAEELKQVFSIIKYDNTRLELLRSLQPQLEEVKNLAILKESLEYEISKQQFNDILKL